MKVRYISDGSDVRVINKSDWPDDVPGEHTEWSEKAGWVQDLPNEVGKWLIESHPKEFEEASNDDDPKKVKRQK